MNINAAHRSHQPSGFIDGKAHGHIFKIVGLADKIALVQKRPIGAPALSTQGRDQFGALRVPGNHHDLDRFTVLRIERLPAWQLPPAPSPQDPHIKEGFSAAKRRRGDQLATEEIGQHKHRRHLPDTRPALVLQPLQNRQHPALHTPPQIQRRGASVDVHTKRTSCRTCLSDAASRIHRSPRHIAHWPSTSLHSAATAQAGTQTTSSSWRAAGYKASE